MKRNVRTDVTGLWNTSRQLIRPIAEEEVLAFLGLEAVGPSDACDRGDGQASSIFTPVTYSPVKISRILGRRAIFPSAFSRQSQLA
jgi:hypothetical protein